jgi:hypothetical protein
MKILVLANCQQSPISSILRSSGLDVEKAVCPIHELTATDVRALEQQLECSDLLIAQHVVGDRYADLGVDTKSLRERHSNVVVIPNIYFSGYHPTFSSLTDFNTLSAELRELIGLNALGPHMDVLPLAAHDLQLSVQALLDLVRSTGRARNSDLADAALQGLAHREVSCDIRISDWIAEHCARSVLFYTFNHPHNTVLTELCKRLVDLLSLKVDVKCRQTPYLSNYRMPVYPVVSAALEVCGDVPWPIGGGADDHRMNVSVDPTAHIARTYAFFRASVNLNENLTLLAKVRTSQAYRSAQALIAHADR